MEKRKDVYEYTPKDSKKKVSEKLVPKNNFFGVTPSVHSTRKILAHARYKGRPTIDSNESTRFSRGKNSVKTQFQFFQNLIVLILTFN